MWELIKHLWKEGTKERRTVLITGRHITANFADKKSLLSLKKNKYTNMLGGGWYMGWKRPGRRDWEWGRLLFL